MTVQFNQTSVADLRKILVDSGKYSEEQANEIKGKAKLVESVMALQITDEPEVNFKEVFQKAEEIKESILNVRDNDSVQNIPSYDSVDWHDYVLGLFDPKELQDGKYPKVDGLRRIAENLLGAIIYSGPRQVFAPTRDDTTGRATVVYEVIFSTLEGEKRYSAVAGSYLGNTDDEYAVFPEAIAETRAEARALRRALRLRVVSAEELTSKDTKTIAQQSTERISDGEWKDDDTISSAQINLITKMTDKLGISLDKFLQLGEPKYSDLKDVPRSIAVDMIKRLNEYQTSSNKALVIPEDIKNEGG